MCTNINNLKNIIFNEELTEEERVLNTIDELNKQAVIDYIESNDIGTPIEELGLTEDDLNNPIYSFDIDSDDLKFSKENFRIIALYRYTSNIYGSSEVGDNTRDFCRALVRKTQTSLLNFNDITALNSANPGLGKGGSNTYSVFNYRGGVNCKHIWRKFYYNEDTRSLVQSPDQPNQPIGPNGGVPGIKSNN